MLRIDIYVILSVWLIGLFGYFVCEAIIPHLMFGYGVAVIYTVSTVFGSVLIFFVYMLKGRAGKYIIRNRTAGVRISSLFDGITFIWWLPVTVLPPITLFHFIIKWSDLSIMPTPAGRLIVLFCAIIGLQFRLHYKLALDENSKETDTVSGDA